MGNYYTIKQIAALYGISTQLVRHYEKIGLISPQRNKNNYRFFSISDIYTLNIIRDLRTLGISLDAIERTLPNRNAIKTKHLLDDTIHTTQQQISELEAQLKGLNTRANLLENLQQGSSSFNEVEVTAYPTRYILTQEAKFNNESEYELALLDLYSNIGQANIRYDYSYVGGIGTLNDDGIMTYSSVFILDDDHLENEKRSELPAGEYAIYRYSGSYTNNATYVQKLLSRIKNLGYVPDSEILEFYLVDFHETTDVKEYITELQVLIKKA